MLEPTSAVFNIGLRRLHTALEYYKVLPSDHETLLAMHAAR